MSSPGWGGTSWLPPTQPRRPRGAHSPLARAEELCVSCSLISFPIASLAGDLLAIRNQVTYLLAALVWLPLSAQAAPEASVIASIITAATRTVSFFLNTSSLLLPQRSGPCGRPAELYNAITLASMRYQAHPPNGLSLYARWLFLGTNFRECPKGEVRRSPIR